MHVVAWSCRNSNHFASNKKREKCCPEGMLEADICGMNHLSAMSLLWLGIFQIVHKTKVFDGLNCWYGWAFSDSSVLLTFQEKIECFGSHNILQICGVPAGHPHVCGAASFNFERWFQFLTFMGRSQMCVCVCVCVCLSASRV